MKATRVASVVGFTALAGIITLIVAIWLTVGGVDLDKVESACEVGEAPEIVRVGDDGDSLTVGSIGQSSYVDAASNCVLAELNAPDSVMAKVLETNANQGRQSDSWDGVEVSWTYHPDDGLQLIVEKS